jgi:hypothetical protein
MKKTMITRIFTIALVSLFTIALNNTALANDDKKNDEKKAIPVELKFIGNIQNQPVFQLSFNNAGENDFTVVVRDEFNTVLYRDYVKGGNVTKKFLLNTDEIGNTAIFFEITGKKTDKTVVYEVNKQSRLVEDLVISKRN